MPPPMQQNAISSATMLFGLEAVLLLWCVLARGKPLSQIKALYLFK